MIPAELNLYIVQGATFSLNVSVFQKDTIRVPMDVNARVTEIPVLPILSYIPAGRYIFLTGATRDYGRIESTVKLAAAAEVGDEKLTVELTKLPIGRGSIGEVFADLTGCTSEAKITGRLHTDTSPKLLTSIFDPDPLLGTVRLTLPDEQTALLPSNLRLGTILTSDELQARERQPDDYDWGHDLLFPDGHIETPLKGLIVVYPNV